MNVDAFVSQLDGVKRSGNGWEARCPAHEDERASLSIKAGDKAVVFKCHAGCDAETVVAAMGVHMKDLFYENGTRPRSEILETYDYHDESGTLLSQVVRLFPKGFRQRKPDGHGGWEWKLGKVRRVLYRLPEVVEAISLGQAVVIVEGEKDADRLASLDVAATTNGGGAGKWRSEYTKTLQGASIVIVPDNDGPGEDHAVHVARSLDGVAKEVRVLKLPDLPPKGDVSDWLDAGGTVEELRLLAGAAPIWSDGPDPGREDLKPEEEESEPGLRDLTHDGLALDLGDHWRDDARYVAAWNSWMFWTGSVWREDQVLLHMTKSRQFLRRLSVRLEPEYEEKARQLRRADTVAKVVGLTRSNEAQAASVEQWDADPWLLGTPGGTVDLQTGVLRAACPTDYITKQAAVTPAPEGTLAPLWTEFLKRITSGDAVLQAYLQRFFGYTLTGSIREDVFVFGYGTGANGKSVCVNTVQGILGAYALSIPSEMLTVGQADRHPTELARLRGIRLAVGSETEQGKRWAESKIKRLTGGDKIPARFMHRDFFEFEPEFKLLIVGNHRPSLRGVDEAMRRRLHLVPFTVTIPKKERDRDLPGKLKEEWPAIFRWIISGCLDWQREGLDPPESVRAATEEYLEAEDALNIWLEDCTEVDVNGWEPSGNLFAAWKDWAEAAGEYVGSQKRLSGLLRERGFTPERLGGSGIRGFRGLRLRPEEGRARGEP